MLFIQRAVDDMPLLDVGRKRLSLPQGGRTGSMTHASVTIQITPESKPAMPSWMGEVAAFAQVLTHTSILKTIAEQVRFARARFGHYDLIDFVAVLIGYMLSSEPTLLAFYDQLAPFAGAYMALFGRNRLPHRSTLSRFRGSHLFKRVWRRFGPSFKRHRGPRDGLSQSGHPGP